MNTSRWNPWLAVISLLSLLNVEAGPTAGTGPSSPAVRQRRIHVVDAENRPVSGATVEGVSRAPWNTAAAAKPQPEWRGVTDDGGIATFAIPDGETTSFLALKAGFALGWSSWIEWGQDTSDAPGSNRIELSAPTRVSGVVQTAEGNPIGGAEVWVAIARIRDKEAPEERFRFLHAALARQRLSTRTAPDGSFRIGGLPEAVSLDLAASKEGWALEPRSSEGAVAPYRAGQTDIRLALVRSASIEGRVVEEIGGVPVAGARVTPFWLRGNDPLRENPLTGPDGFFRLTGLSP